MSPFDMVVMVSGALLMIVGVWLFARRKVEGANHIEALGIKMDVSHPALVLVVLGFLLLLVPRLLPEPAKIDSVKLPPAQTDTRQAAAPAVLQSVSAPLPAVVEPVEPAALNPMGDYHLVSYLENNIVYATVGEMHVVALDKARYQWRSAFQALNTYGQLVKLSYQGEMRHEGNNWFFRVTNSNNPTWFNQGEVPMMIRSENQQLGMRYGYNGADIVVIWQR